MGYVSFNDVIELNGILKEKGLNFKIHHLFYETGDGRTFHIGCFAELYDL